MPALRDEVVMATDVDPWDAEFEAQVGALRRHFLAGLPARRDALSAAWADCLAGIGEASWLALRDSAHRLAGSAACYGLEMLGGQARELDRLLSGAAPCRDADLAAPAVERVLAEVDRAID